MDVKFYIGYTALGNKHHKPTDISINISIESRINFPSIIFTIYGGQKINVSYAAVCKLSDNCEVVLCSLGMVSTELYSEYAECSRHIK